MLVRTPETAIGGLDVAAPGPQVAVHRDGQQFAVVGGQPQDGVDGLERELALSERDQLEVQLVPGEIRLGGCVDQPPWASGSRHDDLSVGAPPGAEPVPTSRRPEGVILGRPGDVAEWTGWGCYAETTSRVPKQR